MNKAKEIKNKNIIIFMAVILFGGNAVFNGDLFLPENKNIFFLSIGISLFFYICYWWFNKQNLLKIIHYMTRGAIVGLFIFLIIYNINKLVYVSYLIQIFLILILSGMSVKSPFFSIQEKDLTDKPLSNQKNTK